MISLSQDHIESHYETETFGWGSEKLYPPEENYSQVSFSTELNELRVEITDAEICENAIGKRLNVTEMCGIAYKKGETATQVINFDKTCVTGIFVLYFEQILSNVNNSVKF